MSDEVKTPKCPILDGIEVPEKEIENWQITVDLLSKIANVPAALIMRVHAEDIEVVVSSHSAGNVYHAGERSPLNFDLYCETVMTTRRELLVPNALKDSLWDNSPDMARGMISYCGLPLTWPGGELFGTICILDEQENAYSQLIRDLLVRFRDSVQFSLKGIYDASVERKQAEKQLQSTSAYTRSLIEASPDPLVTINAEGKITDVNLATEKITGHSRGELIGTDFSDYFTEPEKARAGYQQVFTEGFVRDYPLAIRQQDGQTRDVLYNASVYLDEQGQVVGVFAAVMDITERKQAEKRLDDSEVRFRALVSATAQIVWTTDSAGNVADDIPSWRAYTGQTIEQVRGAGWAEALHPDDVARTLAVWQRAVENRSLYVTEYRLRRHDGQYRSFAVRGVPLQNADGSIYEWVGYCADITERKQAEDEIRRLNEELEQRVIERTAQLKDANKELEAFAYSVSHDLRAPLRHIGGFVELLLINSQEKLDEKGLHYLRVISDSAGQMAKLIDDILSFSRMGRAEMMKISVRLDKLALEAIKILQNEAQGRDIVWDIKPLPVVKGDAGMLQTVLTNLLSNALKYTRPKKQAVIEIGSIPSENETTVYVKDNGVGFDMKYENKLFSLFQRLHRVEEFEGTGVGLANVRRIIHRHGGRTWAEGAVDKGATFYFSLPKEPVAK